MIKVGDIIKTLFKKYEVKEQVDDSTYLVTCKNDKFLLRTFDINTEAGQDLELSLTRIKTSGIKAPKLMLFDRKKGYAIVEYIEGISVAQYISQKDLDDAIYEQLFSNAYLAKTSGATLKYEPNQWLINDAGIIYYVYPHIIKYSEEKDLVKHYISLWFNTKQLEKYLIDLGFKYDHKRIKDEYQTNKEMLLKVVKFYK